MGKHVRPGHFVAISPGGGLEFCSCDDRLHKRLIRKLLAPLRWEGDDS